MWSCSFCVFRVFSSGPYPFRNNLLKGHCKTFFFFDPVALILFCAVVLITAVTNWISCAASCVSFPLRWQIWHTERLSSWIRSFSSSIQQLTVRKQLNFSSFLKSSPLSDTLSCVSLCSPSPEKVHFQHTAKFISQLINEKANYTLQVRGVAFTPL